MFSQNYEFAVICRAFLLAPPPFFFFGCLPLLKRIISSWNPGTQVLKEFPRNVSKCRDSLAFPSTVGMSKAPQQVGRRQLGTLHRHSVLPPYHPRCGPGCQQPPQKELAGRLSTNPVPKPPAPPPTHTWPSPATTFSTVPPHRPTASQARPRWEGPTAVDPPLHQETQSSRLLASPPPFLLSMALNSESHKCCPTELYFQPLPYIYLLTIT